MPILSCKLADFSALSGVFAGLDLAGPNTLQDQPWNLPGGAVPKSTRPSTSIRATAETEYNLHEPISPRVDFDIAVGQVRQVQTVAFAVAKSQIDTNGDVLFLS